MGPEEVLGFATGGDKEERAQDGRGRVDPAVQDGQDVAGGGVVGPVQGVALEARRVKRHEIVGVYGRNGSARWERLLGTVAQGMGTAAQEPGQRRKG